MKKDKNWETIIFALLFIAAPALIGFYFLLPDWRPDNKPLLSYGYIWLISLGFIVFVGLLSALFIYLNYINWSSMKFIIPIVITFSIMYVTYPLPIWARAVLVIVSITFSFPINMFVDKIINKKSFFNKNNKL